MFDLKAKLLATGLVTKEQVEKIDSQKKRPREKIADNFEQRERKKVLDQLRASSKSEQYLAIRKWVDFNRLDKETPSNEEYEKFFVSTKDNQVTWLTLPKSVVEKIANGQAGVINYMSNHGAVHAVVPRDIAEDVGEIFPEWLRVLNEAKSKVD